MARKKTKALKAVTEAVQEIEILDENPSEIADLQKAKQLESTKTDLETYLPELDRAIFRLLNAINAIPDETLNELAIDKLRDVVGALNSLMGKRNEIVKPQQLSNRQRQRIAIVFDKGRAGMSIEQ